MTTVPYIRADLPCAADAACGKPATLVHLTMRGNGNEPMLTCDRHARAGRKILSRETSAVIFTLRLATEGEQMSKQEWAVEYRQTPGERYDTDMNDRAEALVAQHAVLTGGFGGTTMGGPARADGRTSENAVTFTAPDVAAAKRVRDLLAEHLDREVILTQLPVEPEPFDVEDEAEYEEAPGPTLAERAQNAKDAVGWADQDNPGEFNSAVWEFVKVATDAVAEVHRLRADVDRLTAEVSRLQDALPAVEEPSHLRPV